MNKNPSGLAVTVTKKAPDVCPVCGIVTYSRGGIHPQCAQEQADAPRVKRLKAVKKVEKLKVKTPQPRTLGHWQKRCSKCGASAHVRALTCACGQKFA